MVISGLQDAVHVSWIQYMWLQLLMLGNVPILKLQVEDDKLGEPANKD